MSEESPLPLSTLAPPIVASPAKRIQALTGDPDFMTSLARGLAVVNAFPMLTTLTIPRTDPFRQLLGIDLGGTMGPARPRVALGAGARQALGGGVDADHPHRLEHRAALQLVQQVGADVAGADQGAFDFFCHVLNVRKSQ